MPPRAALTSRAPGFNSASTRASMRLRVRSTSGAWTLMKSDRLKRSSSDTSSTSSWYRWRTSSAERSVDADEVRSAEEVLQRYQDDVELLGPLPRHGGIVG